jgi:hypothetical protein
VRRKKKVKPIFTFFPVLELPLISASVCREHDPAAVLAVQIIFPFVTAARCVLTATMTTALT